MTKVFGWIAVGLSLTYKFPQIYKLYMTHDIKGISVFSQIVQASAYAFYITHGTIIEDPPIIMLGIASLIQSLILIVLYFIYKKEAKILADDDTDHKDIEKENELKSTEEL